MTLQRNFIVFRQRTGGHHVPDRHISIGWKNLFCRLGHFVFNKMGLMLDAFTARPRSQRYHMFGNLEVPTMIDPDLSDDQWRLGGTYFSCADLHKRSPRQVPVISS